MDKLKIYNKYHRDKTDGTKELAALIAGKDNPTTIVDIPAYGYVLKPNEVYIIDHPSPGKNWLGTFSKTLTSLGVAYQLIDGTCGMITVSRPVKVFRDTEFFNND